MPNWIRNGSIVVLVGLLTVVAGIAVPTPSQAQQEVTIRYSFFAPSWTFPGMQMQEWSRELEKRVEQRTDGDIQINMQLHPGGDLLGAPETYEGTRNGIADVGLGVASTDAREFPMLSVFSLPLQIPNATVGSQVVWDIIQEYEPDALDDFKVLTAFTGEPAHLQTAEPVRSLEDLEGMEIRTRGAAIPIAKALGISVTGMPMPEVPEALERGLIQGNFSSREVLKDFRMAQYLPYVVDYGADVAVFVAVMNQQRWENLPSEVQTVIDELRREMAVWTGAYHDFINVREAMRWSRQNHGLEVIELSEEERQRWNEALEPVVQNWIEEHEDELPARELVNRVRELRDHYADIWTIQLEE